MARGGRGGIYAFDVIQIYDMLSVLNAIFSAPPTIKKGSNYQPWWMNYICGYLTESNHPHIIISGGRILLMVGWPLLWVWMSMDHEMGWVQHNTKATDINLFHSLMQQQICISLDAGLVAADVLVDMQINGADQECLPVSLFCLSRQLWSREICTA